MERKKKFFFWKSANKSVPGPIQEKSLALKKILTFIKSNNALVGLGLNCRLLIKTWSTEYCARHFHLSFTSSTLHNSPTTSSTTIRTRVKKKKCLIANSFIFFTKKQRSLLKTILNNIHAINT